MDKLPIWGTVKDSFDFCFSRLGTMAKLATVPLMLYLFIIGVAFAFAPEVFNSNMEDVTVGNGLSIVLNILSAIAIIPFATAWHRQYLNHEKTPSGWLSYSFGKKETRYLIFSILLVLIVGAVAIVPSFIGTFLWQFSGGDGLSLGEILTALAIVLFSFFVVVRLVMIFPAAAVGASAGFMDSWRATKGSFWRMTAIYILLGLLMIIPLAVISVIIVMLLGGALVSGEPSAIAASGVISAMILVPFEMIASALGVSCLSIIYKFLSEKDNVVHAAD